MRKCIVCDGDIVDSDLVADMHMQAERGGGRAHMRCHRAYWAGVEWARSDMVPKPIVCPRCQERHGHPVHWCRCVHPYHVDERALHVEQHQRECMDVSCHDPCHT